MITLKNITAVAIGAFLGAIGRFYISRLNLSSLPLGTLITNVFGSFILCFIIEITMEHIKISDFLKHMVTTGFLSSFTTFSSFVFEIIRYLIKGKYSAAVIYSFLSIIFGLIASILGFESAEIISRNQRKREYDII